MFLLQERLKHLCNGSYLSLNDDVSRLLTPISPPLLRFIEEAELSHSEPADGQPLFSGHCSLVIAFSGNSAWTEIRGCQRGWDTENQRHLLYYVINRSHAPEDLKGARASEVPKSLSF